uniref:Uncharacterized protein n=1 Tax=Medicago truncatula TaxID=3880 RepID=A2Q5E7_MEDTR|nr:hypothetical protein MtrDRAFT_AC161399g48v2 [Medicago truncatula]
MLQQNFKLKIRGDCTTFCIHLCQRKCVLKFLQDTGFISCKPSLIPMDPKISLNHVDGDLVPDISAYRMLIEL